MAFFAVPLPECFVAEADCAVRFSEGRGPAHPDAFDVEAGPALVMIASVWNTDPAMRTGPGPAWTTCVTGPVPRLRPADIRRVAEEV